MIGQHSLFSDVFCTNPAKGKIDHRPRNFFQPERNEALLHRYYFHAEINRYRYDDCLLMLEKEFYLTSMRIMAILRQNVDALSNIVNSKPSTAQMNKKFPHFKWTAR